MLACCVWIVPINLCAVRRVHCLPNISRLIYQTFILHWAPKYKGSQLPITFEFILLRVSRTAGSAGPNRGPTGRLHSLRPLLKQNDFIFVEALDIYIYIYIYPIPTIFSRVMHSYSLIYTKTDKNTPLERVQWVRTHWQKNTCSPCACSSVSLSPSGTHARTHTRMKAHCTFNW